MPKLPVANFKSQSEWLDYLAKLTPPQTKKVATALNRILRTEYRLNTKKTHSELLEDIKRLYSVNNNTKLLQLVNGIEPNDLPQPKPTKKQAAEARKARLEGERKAKRLEAAKVKVAEAKLRRESRKAEEERMKQEEEQRMKQEEEARIKKQAEEEMAEFRRLNKKTIEYKVVIKPPKVGEPGYVSNFSKLTPIEQLNIVLKSAVFTGQPPDKSFYQTIAEDFYTNINSILSKSPYTAVKDLVNKYKFTPKVLKLLYEARTQSDFYPTGEKAINNFINNDHKFLRSGWQGRELRVKLLEGTSGIGSVAFWFNKEFPELRITLNELDEKMLELSKLLLGDKDSYKYINEDFFKLGKLRFPYDIIFLNPPFMQNQGYLKFVLQAIKYLTQGKENGRLYLICPTLTSKQYTSDIGDWVKDKNDDSGRILPNRFFKMLEEVSPGATANNNWNNDFQIDICEKLGTTNDFGGTKVKADLYKIITK